MTKRTKQPTAAEVRRKRQWTDRVFAVRQQIETGATVTPGFVVGDRDNTGFVVWCESRDEVIAAANAVAKLRKSREAKRRKAGAK